MCKKSFTKRPSSKSSAKGFSSGSTSSSSTVSLAKPFEENRSGGGGAADIPPLQAGDKPSGSRKAVETPSLSPALMKLAPAAPSKASDVNMGTLAGVEKKTTETSPKVVRRTKRKAEATMTASLPKKSNGGQKGKKGAKKATKTLADLIGSKSQKYVGKGAKNINSSGSESDRKLRSHKL